MMRLPSFIRSYNTGLYFLSSILLSISVSIEAYDLKWIPTILLAAYFLYHLLRVITANKSDSKEKIVSKGQPKSSNTVSVPEQLNLLGITIFIFSSVIGSLALLSILYFIYFSISYHYFGKEFFSDCTEIYTGSKPPLISELSIDIINVINGGDKSELTCLGSSYTLGKAYIKLFILFLAVAGAIDVFKSKH